MTTCISAIPKRLFATASRCIPSKLALGMTCGACIDTSSRVLNYVLRRYTTQPAYLRSLIAQKPRLDLCGQAVGTVTHEEREAAKAHLNEWKKRRRPRASRRQQVDEAPRPSHPQPKPADSTSTPAVSQSPAATHHERRLPDTWQRILSYLATAEGPQRPVAIGRCAGAAQSWWHPQTDAGARVGAAGDQGALRNHERTTRPPGLFGFLKRPRIAILRYIKAKIAGNGDFYGAVHAPTANAMTASNGELYGAAIGKTLTTTGHGEVHDDECLGKGGNNSGDPFREGFWQLD